MTEKSDIPKTESSRETLSQRSFSALRWNFLGTALRNLSQLLIGILLARILGPEPFGVVAVAWLILGVGNLVSDLGFGAALIQRKDLVEQDLRFVFTCQVSLGMAFTLSGVMLSEIIAAFFSMPDAVLVLQAMFFLFFLQSIGQTSAAVLRRALDYKSLQRIGIVSHFVGYLLIGVPLALAGLGVWSLVAAQLSQTLINTLGLLLTAAVPWRPTWLPASSGLFGFGSKVLGANLASYSISNLDSVVIGRMLGVLDLGVYNRAMMLVASPMNTVTTSLQSVLFSACSRLQSEKSQLLLAYSGASLVIALICLPVFITVAMIPETVITGLYGDKWAAAIPVLTPLALAMPVNALLALIGPVLMATDKVALELKAQLITLLFMLPLLYFTSRYSLVAVAWGILGIYLLRWAMLLRALLTVLDGRWIDTVRLVRWPLLFALITALSTKSADYFLSQVPATLRVVADVIVATGVLLVCIRVFGRLLLDGPNGKFWLDEGLVPPILQRFLRIT